MDTRLVIPPALQEVLLAKIHEGHLGINKCRSRTRQSIWWQGMRSELKNLVEKCPNCIEQRSNTKQPFIKETFLARPWQKVGIDLFKLDV